MRPSSSAHWLVAVGLLGVTATTHAFLTPAPVAILPARARPVSFMKGRSTQMINLPRFNFGNAGGKGPGEAAVKDVEVAVNQIRGGSAVASPSVSAKITAPPPPSFQQELKLEDRGLTTKPKAREPSPPITVNTDVELTPIVEDASSIQGASAVVGAVVGLAVGGPLLALWGAALLSFSCTASNEAGDAARGTGKTTLEAYNFVAKVDKKKRFIKKLADWAVSLYYKIKRDYFTDKEAIDKAETTLKKGLEVTAELYVKYDVPSKLGKVLEKTGELSVAAVRAVIKYNKEFKITERALKLIRDAGSSSSSSSSTPASSSA